MPRVCSSLTLREGFSKTHQSSLTLKGGSTTFFRKPTRPSLPLRKAFFESLRLPFQRELHLFPQAPSSSEGGGCNRSYSELKPLRYKVGGPSEVCARLFVREEPHGHGDADFSRNVLLSSADGMFFLKLKDNNLNYMARLHWEGVASCPPIKKCPNL